MDEIALRPATAEDFGFFFALHKESLGPYVDQVWGWEDDDQRAYLERNLVLPHTRVIVVNGSDVGSLTSKTMAMSSFSPSSRSPPSIAAVASADSSSRRYSMRAFADGKRVRLSVLQVNTRAYQLYRRLGFTEVLREGVAPETRIRMVAQPS